MFGFGSGGIDFTPETDIPDLAGKIIFVTGGTTPAPARVRTIRLSY